MMESMLKVAKTVAGLEHADFAMIANPKVVGEETFKTLRVLGVHVPGESVIGGRLMRNPVIGMAIDEILAKYPYKDVAAYMITSTLGHEAFHAFVENTVKKYDPSMPEHVKAQVKAYTQMLDNVQALSYEQRVVMAQQIVDVMMPRARTRSIDPQTGQSVLNPEWQGYLRGAVQTPEEFAAFVYGHAIMAFVGEGVNEVNPRRVAQKMQDKMRWLDDGTREFFRGQFGNLG